MQLQRYKITVNYEPSQFIREEKVGRKSAEESVAREHPAVFCGYSTYIKRLQDPIFHPITRENLREIDVDLFAEIHLMDEGLSIAPALKAENPVAPRETNRKREEEEKLKMYDSTERETTRCVGLSSVKLYEERDNREIRRGSESRSISRIFF